jgi:isoquinoline 1-oxidoreductase beta subunit
MTNNPTFSRRDFLKVSAGTSLIISIYLTGCQTDNNQTPGPTSPSGKVPEEPTEGAPVAEIQPDVFLKIDSTGVVTVIVSKPELGQGVRTALPMILAEELCTDWNRVKIEQASASNEFGNQVVGGSASISGTYQVMRSAGILARELMVATAAKIWGVNPVDCYAENGMVIQKSSGEKLSFGELVTTASEIKSVNPGNPIDPENYKIVGTPVKRVDGPQIVDGTAVFGSDVIIPGMSFAVLARSPTVGGVINSFDGSKAMAVPGVRHVVQIEDSIAVVTENTWQAIKGREALEISWGGGQAILPESLGLRKIKQKHASYFVEDGRSGTPKLASLVPINAKVRSDQDPNWLEVSYHIPHFAHAPMEPMNSTADIRDDFGEIWAPTQDPERAVARRAAGLESQPEGLKVNIPLIGGGFGRRLEVDYVLEAIKISKAVGEPVKLIWTREDDIRHDFFHIGGTITARALLNSPMLPRISAIPASTSVRTGAWRSVQNFDDAFARECFIDEYAEVLGRDPVDLRMEIYTDVKMRTVLERVATEAGWGTPLAEGKGRGIACYSTWNVTPVAEVAEVSISDDGTIRVHRVVCAVDCGLVINPDMVKQQMEGGIAFALSAALKNAITVEDGRVQQSNFHDYPILRMDEMPVVEVHILPSDRSPTGVGEMGGPPLAPAVANALYTLTGVRIRQLPIKSNLE